MYSPVPELVKQKREDRKDKMRWSSHSSRALKHLDTWLDTFRTKLSPRQLKIGSALTATSSEDIVFRLLSIRFISRRLTWYDSHGVNEAFLILRNEWVFGVDLSGWCVGNGEVR